VSRQELDLTPSGFLGVPQSNLVDRACWFAVRAHQGQKRRCGQIYLMHPLRVARTVGQHGGSAEMVAAALLHDVVEDTSVTLGEVVNLFGETVGGLVEALTCRSTPQDGNRARRKQRERERLAAAGPEVATIKLADIIDNSKDIGSLDPTFASVYLPEQLALTFDLVKGDAELRKRAFEVVYESLRVSRRLRA